MATASVEPRLPSWWLEDALAREGDPSPSPALSGDGSRSRANASSSHHDGSRGSTDAVAIRPASGGGSE